MQWHRLRTGEPTHLPRDLNAQPCQAPDHGGVSPGAPTSPGMVGKEGAMVGGLEAPTAAQAQPL